MFIKIGKLFTAMCFITSHLLFGQITNEKLCKMPKADILHERLCALGVGHFDEKTKLSQNLGEQEIYALGVELKLQFAHQIIKHI